MCIDKHTPTHKTNKQMLRLCIFRLLFICFLWLLLYINEVCSYKGTVRQSDFCNFSYSWYAKFRARILISQSSSTPYSEIFEKIDFEVFERTLIPQRCNYSYIRTGLVAYPVALESSNRGVAGSSLISKFFFHFFK